LVRLYYIDFILKLMGFAINQAQIFMGSSFKNCMVKLEPGPSGSGPDLFHL